jgi:hypothetical protein
MGTARYALIVATTVCLPLSVIFFLMSVYWDPGAVAATFGLLCVWATVALFVLGDWLTRLGRREEDG